MVWIIDVKTWLKGSFKTKYLDNYYTFVSRRSSWAERVGSITKKVCANINWNLYVGFEIVRYAYEFILPLDVEIVKSSMTLKLIHLTTTWPGITFINQFLENCKQLQWEAISWVLYLKGTIGMNIFHKKHSNFDIVSRCSLGWFFIW